MTSAARGALIETEQGFKVYRIRAATGGGEAAIVPELGAVVSSLRLPGPDGLREVLFRHPHFWDPAAVRTRGGIPFLFPVCGRLERNGQSGAYLFDGHVYEMKIHGFAMRGPWEVVKADGASLTVCLADSPASLGQFPFSFRIMLVFRFEGEAFVIDQSYENTGKRAFPYYAGFHPYFLTPEPGAGKEAVMLNYKPCARWLMNERLTDIVGTVAPPAMPCSLTDPAINEILTQVGPDREVVFTYPDGLELHTRADGLDDPAMFPFVQLYTMADRPFYCVEPWMGFPNALNAAAGARWLAAGQTERGRLHVWTSLQAGRGVGA